MSLLSDAASTRSSFCMIVYSLRPPQVGNADIEKYWSVRLTVRADPRGSTAPWHKDQLCHTSAARWALDDDERS
ncbi:hypothetical protein GCM10009786_12470 [Leucobacter alluvii]|uniref:Uncharacterized protein n=1 Tax=Leucobacter alluvii TaxID=340321 RepID=A0ABN3B4N6_9MICO